jgi:serine protease Do
MLLVYLLFTMKEKITKGKRIIKVAVIAAILILAGNSLFDIFYSNSAIQKANAQTNYETQPVVSEQSSVTAAVKKSLPSVVTIGIDAVVQTLPTVQSGPFGAQSIIPGQTQEIKQNIASGFIVSQNGLIVTNKHVVADTSASYSVVTNDGKKYNVTQIYRDPLNDLAILKIDANNLTPMTLGDSSSLELGQTAIAIGTPLGQFSNTVTEGIISGLNRNINAGSPLDNSVERLDNIIQTDAAINPGNSGGPLINIDGQAIGINTAVSTQGQNIGFAIPINTVKSVLSNFQKNGSSFVQPFLGVRYQMLSQQDAVLNNLPQGAYVISVVSGSPADKAGVQQKDVITKFNDQKLNTDNDLTTLVNQKKPGDKVTLTIFRNGQTITKEAILSQAQ